MKKIKNNRFWIYKDESKVFYPYLNKLQNGVNTPLNSTQTYKAFFNCSFMKKIKFFIPDLTFDEQGKLILEKLNKTLSGKSEKKKKNGNKK